MTETELVIALSLGASSVILYSGWVSGWRRTARLLVLGSLASGASLVLLAHPVLGLGLSYASTPGPRLASVPVVWPLVFCAMIAVTGGVADALLAHRRAGAPLSTDGITWLALVVALLVTAGWMAGEPLLRAATRAWEWRGQGPYFGAPFASALWLSCLAFVVDAALRHTDRWKSPTVDERSSWATRVPPVLVFGLGGLACVLFGDPPQTRMIAATVVGVPTALAASLLLGARRPAEREV